jgi:hypothetical protein
MANFAGRGAAIGSQLPELHVFLIAVGFDRLAAEQGSLRFITGRNPSRTGKAEGYQQNGYCTPCE